MLFRYYQVEWRVAGTRSTCIESDITDKPSATRVKQKESSAIGHQSVKSHDAVGYVPCPDSAWQTVRLQVPLELLKPVFGDREVSEQERHDEQLRLQQLRNQLRLDLLDARQQTCVLNPFALPSGAMVEFRFRYRYHSELLA